MLIYWIWLAELKGLSCSQKKMLLQHFHDPEEIYHSSLDAFTQVEGVTKDMLQALEDKSLAQAEKILTDCAAKDIQILTLSDSCYPSKLRNTYDPPIVLYCKGKLPNWEKTPVIGMVGTRKSSPYGMRAARSYGAQIAACGGAVISGGAAGIDTMAQEGALEAAGTVLCVFGCGVDVYYPARNKSLFEEIAVRGCLISEYPPKTEPLRWHFPRRNRIVSGMSRGILVVEAGHRSGALETAGKALEHNRDVFAVPGPIDSPDYVGTNNLIKDGAYAVTAAGDILRVYGAVEAAPAPRKLRKKPVRAPKDPAEKPGKREKPAEEPASIKPVQPAAEEALSDSDIAAIAEMAVRDPEGAILAAVGQRAHLDEIIERTGLPAGEVMVSLTMLELQGVVAQKPGNYYEKQR